MPFGFDDYIIASIAAPVITGAIGSALSGDDRQRAQDAFQQSLDIIKSIGAPPDLAREIILKQFQQVGVLTPELEQAINLEAPKVAGIQEDPIFKQASMDALRLLGQTSKTGFTPEMRAGLAQIQLQQASDDEAKRQQILQSFQQRGLGSGGAELASQLQAQSAGAARAGEAGLQLQAQARQAALQAASQSGQLAGQIRGQEFGIAQTKASAQDQAAMARFNEAVARQQRNVATQMGVQQQNLGMAQQIANQNVAQQNAELQRQRAAQAQQYELRLRQAGLLAGGQQTMGQQYQQQAARTGQMWAGMGNAVGQGFMQAGLHNQQQSGYNNLLATLGKNQQQQQHGNWTGEDITNRNDPSNPYV